jgi:CDGSH-type Zn-finger protein
MKRKTALNAPYAIEVVAGQTYQWCSCGLSQTQPFCDTSHQVTDCIPLEYIPTESKKVYFCGCKNSNNSPLCDGTHNKQ